MASALGLSSPSNFASVGTLQSTLANEQAAAGAGNPQAPMLRIADGLFLQQGVALQSGFLSTLSQSFGATPQSVDFTTPAATQTVNEWVDQQTEGLIPKIVEQFPPETELVLANALYLKAEWRSPFEPGETRPATFTAPGGPETVPFMHRAEQLDYAESSEYTAVQIPYAASPLALLVVMPSPGTSVDTLEQQLDEPTLASLVGSLTPTRLNLSLPSFQIALPSTSIIPQLQALGMTDAFEPGLAEFPKITAGGPPLFISVVQHAADFAVNEQGTIAAAVTAVGAQPVDAEMPPQVSSTPTARSCSSCATPTPARCYSPGASPTPKRQAPPPELDARLGRIARRAPAAGGRPRERSVSSLAQVWCQSRLVLALLSQTALFATLFKQAALADLGTWG